ncbi:MAG: molybdenum cofactor biosynthesis protein MoaE [Spirochaetia bacterium]|nr:molybdenum cofactor biosynthesis protein MoaE [Spirochaetia bacterium]
MKYLTRSEIKLNEIIQEAKHPASGGIVVFSGDTRNHNKGKAVLYLEYESHESMAEKMIEEILNDAKEKWNLNYAFCQHRLGRVDIKESAVAVVTSSAHRKQAYESNIYIIDAVKSTVPIWKHEYFEDGSVKWGEPQTV